MITDINFEEIYKNLLDKYNSPNISNRQRIVDTYQILLHFYKNIYKNEKRHFSSPLAGINFVNDKYELVPNLRSIIGDLLNFRKILRKNRNIIPSIDEVNYIFKYSCLIIEALSGSSLPEDITIIIKSLPHNDDLLSYKSKREITDLLGCIVSNNPFYKRKIDATYIELECSHDEFEFFLLKVGYPFLENAMMIYPGMCFNLISAEVIRDNPFTLSIRSGGLFVFEPDYLIDATDIAESFGVQDGYKLYFLKRFFASEVSLAMVKGNLINTLFDELILNPEIDFATACQIAFKQKPLSLIAITGDGKASKKQLIDDLSNDFTKIKDIISSRMYNSFEGAEYSVEPSFISPVYGIQGRMDLLAEYHDDELRKDIIELKSGRPAPEKYAVRVSNNAAIPFGVWQNHLAQVLCYNLLLESTFRGRKGNSSILYIKADTEPIRDVASMLNVNQNLMLLRNNIIMLENSIMHRSFKFFDNFGSINFEMMPSYISSKISRLIEKFISLNNTEKMYFLEYSAFTLRERYAVKTGFNQDIGDYGFSSLWRSTIDEKRDNNSILTDLTINTELSNFDTLNIALNVNLETAFTSFRKGDIVILYSYYEGEELNVAGNQLLKCVIKDICNNIIIVSLRNKTITSKILDSSLLWVLESDQIDSVERYIFSSLYQFVQSSKLKKDLLFGYQKPEFSNNYFVNINGINANQNEIIQKAINTQNYYLIQGPPGTGKTNLVLKNIVSEFITQTSDNILICAYTNRAVDEIAGAIKSVGDIDFVRIGSKEASQDSEHHFPQIIEKYGINYGRERLHNSRIVLSTVASVHTNSELFEIKKFDTLIVDEASQILESYLIGLVCKVRRFILIGDEKQLPPVVVQNPLTQICDNIELQNIGIRNFSESLFERLVRVNQKYGWSDSIGMLSFQARMHSHIQEFPGKYFYNNLLYIMGVYQDRELTEFDSKSESPYERILASGRVIFIDCPVAMGKISTLESEICFELIKVISSKIELTNETIGVISPFRVQCFEIYKRLSENQKLFINVDTVERYQGSQRDFIIMSASVGNNSLLERIISPNEDLSVDRKLNVAITRAKSHFILLGNSTILSRSVHYNNLINYIKSKGSYFPFSSIVAN